MLAEQQLIYKVLNRDKSLFLPDISKSEQKITEVISQSKFLVIGGAGSIGREVTREIFKRGAKLLHVVDLSENNLVELVRFLRSELAYTTKKFDTFAIDSCADYFKDFLAEGDYDYVLNLSAMKHVRNENSIFSMLRMIQTNILGPVKHCEVLSNTQLKKYFCVSSDKAANPANFMGATKRVMEYALFGRSHTYPISMARFANVAFSDGSLLDGFRYRLTKRQPITIPKDIKRFFISPEEAGQICLLSTLFANDNQIAIPSDSASLQLTSFNQILKETLKLHGLAPHYCHSEEEARTFFQSNSDNAAWPVFMFESDTTGEKKYEEFHTSREVVSEATFDHLSYVNFVSEKSVEEILNFVKKLSDERFLLNEKKSSIIEFFEEFLVGFQHDEKNKYLNQRM